MLKRYFGIIVSFILVSFAIFIAFIVRGSFIDNTIYNPTLFLNHAVHLDEKPIQFYDDSISTLDSLLLESELVVKVKPTANQLIQSKSTLSEALVTDVFKGDSSLLDTNINIYEYGFIEAPSQTLVSPNGYIPMNPMNEYILFLSTPTPTSAYEKNFYVPLNRKYSKYSLSSSDHIKYTDTLKFENIYNFNIILNNEKDIQTYTKIKNDLLLRFSPEK